MAGPLRRHALAVVALGLVVVLGVLGAIFGEADLPLGYAIGGLAALAIAAITAAEAMGAESDSRKVSWWAATAGALTVYVVVSFAFLLVGSGEDPPLRTYVLAGASESECLRPSSQPGGERVLLTAQLCGGQPHQFECRATAEDGTEWLRLARSLYWAPESRLDPVESMIELPRCRGF